MNRGEVALDDPAEKFLPQAAGALTLRDYTGAPIRLVDLATHRSGFAAFARQHAERRAERPLRRLSRVRFAALPAATGRVDREGWRYRQRRKRDERYEYSNLGFGLLGYVLGRAAGTTYADLLQRRVVGRRLH